MHNNKKNEGLDLTTTLHVTHVAPAANESDRFV
jgi:hypothetical protein